MKKEKISFMSLIVIEIISFIFCIFMIIVDINKKNNEESTPILTSEFTYDLDVTDVTEEVKEVIDPIEEATKRMQEEMEEIESITDKKEWFLAYKDIVYRYTKWFDPPETVFDCFTEEEIDLIFRAVETEVYDKDFNSKANVASVIFNRIERGGKFGNTVEKVITAPKQFAYGRTNITKDTILAVMYAWEIEDTTDGCVAFRSDIQLEKWRKWNYVFTDDAGHHFYR